MKGRMIVGIAGVLGIALVTATSRTAQAQGITLAQLAGNWAGEASATFALCLNTSLSAFVNCKEATPHVVFYTQTDVAQSTIDVSGNLCTTLQVTNSPEFPNAAAPATAQTQVATQKTTFYNSTTETGSTSFTVYVEGAGTFCQGSVLVNTAKASPISSGTLSFVVSLKGTRIDSVTDTNVGSPIPYVADFVSHTAVFKQ